MDTTSTLKALGHVDSLRILTSLKDGGKTLRQMETELGMHAAMVLKHVRMMCKAGVVEIDLPGGSQRYRLAPMAVALLRRMRARAT